uniref:Hspb associated protein 1 n=1 Tax=Nothobranchius korthausae TaxID=1143690 RepID=A0A1A8F8V2_9TELE
MAAVTSIKPFSPEETQRILHHLQQPAVFLKMTCDWPVLHWTAEHLSNCLNDTLVRFRLGRREETHAPLFETQCSYAEATVAQFLRWTRGQTDVGPFSDFSLSEHWVYADYKYIAALFQHQPSMFEDVKWSDFGFEGRNGKESTLWIGVEAANTPCHQDTYGFNLVLQVLFVPRHWWHYVESVDSITVSVNTWIELEVDNVARVTEAVTRTVVSAVKSSESDDNTDNWLNPTEEGVPSHRENMQYLNLAVRACAQRTRRLSPDLTDARPTKRDSRGQVKKHGDRADASEVFEVPLGPHLIPVSCQHDEWKKTVPEDSEINTSQEDSAGGSEGSVGTNPTRSSQGKQSCGAGLPPRGCAEQEHDAPEDCAEENRSFSHTSITTNDLLDCLVHPDVISHITELLLERHIGGHL